MDVAIALHAVAALLLIWAGVSKLAVPHPAAHLMGGLGLPSRAWAARLVGAAELAIGCFAIAVGGPVAVASVSVAYVLFAVVVLRAMVVGVPSCGCFGQNESPPSRIHLAGSLLLAGVSAVTVGSGRSPADIVTVMAGRDPMVAVALVLTVGVLAGLLVVAFTAFPEMIHTLGVEGGGGRGAWTRVKAPRALQAGTGKRP